MIQKFFQIIGSIKTRVLQSFFSFLRFFWGFICCWTPLTAPLLAGWMNRYMLRSALRVWVKRSQLENPNSFYEAADVRAYKDWPLWFDAQQTQLSYDTERKNLFSRLLQRMKIFFLPLWGHYRSGLLSLFNTWLLCLPLTLIWLWMWWAGWNNTFSRGYEEEGLAAIVSLLSVFVFSLLMLYLPIAQARQAVHGTWKSFFEIRTVRIIAGHVPFRLLVLSLFYALGSAGIMAGTKVFPTFFEQAYKIDLNNHKILEETVFIHFFFVILCFYCGLLFVKRMNARVYAIGVLKALQAKDLSPDDLSPLERTLLLERLSFSSPKPKVVRPRWVRFMAWPLLKLRTLILAVLTLAVWGSVAFSVYFGQFINLSHFDWLNMPMIQMPYIRVPEVHSD